MQRSKVILSAILVLAMGIAGCVKPDPNFQSPLGAYPKITVDFVDNVTKVYAQGYTDLRYSNITIKAFHGNVTYSTVSENNTYLLHLSVTQEEFTLNVTAVQLKSGRFRIYAFEANFTVRPASDPSVFLQISIYNPNGSPNVDKLKDPVADLPWVTLAERTK